MEMTEKKENISKYNSGWRVGQAKGVYDTLVKVHEICEANNLDKSLFPKIPVRGSNSLEKLQKKKEKLQAQLAKACKQEEQFKSNLSS